MLRPANRTLLTIFLLVVDGCGVTNEEIQHRRQKDEEERKVRVHEEELKFEREKMEMKLEFEHQLE